MNWKLAFFISIAALILSVIWGNHQARQAKYHAEIAAQLHSQHATSDFKLKDSIPAEKAEVDTLLFKEFRQKLVLKKDAKKNHYDELLIKQMHKLRGFKLQHGELAEMLSVIDENSTVYAMMCINPQTQYEDDMIDLLFQVHNPNKSEDASLADGDDDDFFDFTEPCPPACPDN